jgi:hypothetical protein
MGHAKNPVDRRAMLAGAGAVGALAAAASLLPTAKQAPAVGTADDKAPADTTAGYRLTDHVKRYYRTARI